MKKHILGNGRLNACLQPPIFTLTHFISADSDIHQKKDDVQFRARAVMGKMSYLEYLCVRLFCSTSSCLALLSLPFTARHITRLVVLYHAISGT